MFSPLQKLREFHSRIIERTITANLKKAQQLNDVGHTEGCRRHLGHALQLSYRHVPERLPHVQQTAIALGYL